ncbi:Fic family protein [Bradyrhizobium sp. CB1650]|uniref:Fic family protein n=1 Tax=Bradyrhizobium sp. CB1650 TaxID=3039153 RepID=UPI0024359DB3|nr:Fic family protein [Bradyrhizobium sp. CB1650]WGD51421.1 Fic family protein [Bradyrhizobium sp. CB1650]
MAVTRMEPMIPAENKDLTDLATDLVAKASGLAARLSPALRASIGDLVRSMNCYYSNLIENHTTTLIDIDRALKNDFAKEPEKRNLQLEAKAHIEVQEIIDRGEAPGNVLTTEFILWLHREFYSRVPEEMWWVENPQTKERVKMTPGELRTRHVQIGLHVPPDPDELPDFLRRFCEAYSAKMLSKIERIIGVAASHHRLAWIHPFLDGNGRVARLLSHALLRELGLGSQLWSISRGLARASGEYKAGLQAADEPRRGDLDGRGNLTQAGLANFCRFFLTTCVDQVDFMGQLLEPSELMNRVEIWTKEEIAAKRLAKGSWPMLRLAVMQGEFKRGDASDITGYAERQARTVLNQLIDKGYLVSPTTRSPVRLGFPPDVIDRWFPRLYQPRAL